MQGESLAIESLTRLVDVTIPHTWYPRPSTMCCALTQVWVLTLKMLAALESSPPVTSTLPSTSREMPAFASLLLDLVRIKCVLPPSLAETSGAYVW